MIRLDVFDKEGNLLFRKLTEEAHFSLGLDPKNDIVLPSDKVRRFQGELKVSASDEVSFSDEELKSLKFDNNGELFVEDFRFKVSPYGILSGKDAIKRAKREQSQTWLGLPRHVYALIFSIGFGALQPLLFEYDSTGGKKTITGAVSFFVLYFGLWLIFSVASRVINGRFKMKETFKWLNIGSLLFLLEASDFFAIDDIFGGSWFQTYGLLVFSMGLWLIWFYRCLKLVFEQLRPLVLAGGMGIIVVLIVISSNLKYVDMGEGFMWRVPTHIGLVYPGFDQSAGTVNELMTRVGELADKASQTAKKF